MMASDLIGGPRRLRDGRLSQQLLFTCLGSARRYDTLWKIRLREAVVGNDLAS